MSTPTAAAREALSRRDVQPRCPEPGPGPSRNDSSTPRSTALSRDLIFRQGRRLPGGAVVYSLCLPMVRLPLAPGSAGGFVVGSNAASARRAIRRGRRVARRPGRKHLDRAWCATATPRAATGLHLQAVHQTLTLQRFQHAAYRWRWRTDGARNFIQRRRLLLGQQVQDPRKDHRSAQSSVSGVPPPRLPHQRSATTVNVKIAARPRIQASELRGCAA